jgi:hypothetical protein
MLLTMCPGLFVLPWYACQAVASARRSCCHRALVCVGRCKASTCVLCTVQLDALAVARQDPQES